MMPRLNSFIRLALAAVLFLGSVFSGNFNLYAKEDSPFKMLMEALGNHHFDTADISLETEVPESILRQITPELQKAFGIKQEVSFPREANVSEVLTALLEAKYANKSDKKVDFYKIQYSLKSNDFAQYLERYPKSSFASEAKSKMMCTQQHESWLAAVRSRYRNAFVYYAREYGTDKNLPLCKYEGYNTLAQADRAQVQAIEEWLSLLESDKAASRHNEGKVDCTRYADYLYKYGEASCFAGEARDSLDRCMDRNAWQQAWELGTIESYQAYVDQFPRGSHSRYAQGKIVDWTAWKNACEKDSYEGYLEYYRNFPKGDFVSSAQKELIPDEANAVDLGLPSGTRWAPWNVGAVSPEEYGDYYAWGEIKPKTDYSWATCIFFKDRNGNGKPWSGEITDSGEIIDIGDDISGTEYDVAHVKWGGEWRMPTKAQCQELIDKCKWTWWITQDLQEGYKVTGPNGNSIFLPAAGYRYDKEDVARAGFRGGYWSSDRDSSKPFNSFLLRFKEYDALGLNPVLSDMFANSIRYGRSVRPVTNVKHKQQLSRPAKQVPAFPVETDVTKNTPIIVVAGHNAVDLGLPSGTKWADRNMGSSSPADYGDYYAWGEINTKKTYTDKTYKFFTDKNKNGYCDNGEIEDIGPDISGTEYDVAHKKWGGSWKLPTKEQWQELIDYCSWTFMAQDCHPGYKVTGPNGRCIFLPAAGKKAEYSGADRSIGSEGSYLSSMKGTYGLSHLCFWWDRRFIGEGAEYFGNSVRPVTK